MKFLLLALIMLQVAATAAPVEKLTDFELTDQDSIARSYRFPKTKVTVMTVADHKGSDQLAPWIQALHDHYGKRIDIDGIADVSMIAKPFHGIFREAFKKRLTYSVMLDWGGSVVKEFAYTKGVANVYVIDCAGHILKQITGPMREEAKRGLFEEINRTLLVSPSK